MQATLQAAHHLLLAHGLGVQALRAELPGAEIGIVCDVKPYTAAGSEAADVQAVRRGDGFFNRWFLDPLFKARYPSDIAAELAPWMPVQGSDDLSTIAAPIDSLGINYYTRGHVRHDATRPYPHTTEERVPGAHYSAMGWEDYPQGLHDMLLRIHREYAPAQLYVAENGAAEDDVPAPGGRVHDAARVRYLQGHWAAAARALADGVPLRAYFAWSLLDNFEWGHGYRRRFGIVHVDFATQQRTPKDSALAYRDFIAGLR